MENVSSYHCTGSWAVRRAKCARRSGPVPTLISSGSVHKDSRGWKSFDLFRDAEREINGVDKMVFWTLNYLSSIAFGLFSRRLKTPVPRGPFERRASLFFVFFFRLSTNCFIAVEI